MSEVIKTRRVAKFRMSYKILVELLNLPKGAEIVLVHGDALMHEYQKVFEVYVEHQDLNEVPQSHMVPEILPTWETIDGEEHFKDWGQAGTELPRRTPEPENPDIPIPTWENKVEKGWLISRKRE